ncbi:MAG: vWA domain-containing protein [Planctomycetaceae bacterium]
MSSLERARLWWQRTTGEEETPLDGDTPAWAVSMLVHVVVLVALASLMVPPEQPAAQPIAILHTPDDPAEPDAEPFTPPEEVVVTPDEDEAGAQSAAGEAVAASVAPLVADTPQVPVEPVELFDAGDIQVDPFDAELLPQGLEFTDTVAIRGDVAVGTTGASGAVDRLTAEIRTALEQRPVLVVWVFDQSVSLVAQRQEIARRLERVFDELGADAPAADRPDVLHMVYAYGNAVTPIVLKPTRDGAAVVEAIESIPVDESGVELTFTALATAAKAAKAARGGPTERNVMLVCFTDEVGNDQHLADQVSTFCRAQALRIYVVGVPAPFGRQQVEVRFVEFDPKYAAADRFPVVDQGPETLHPEVVRIGIGTVADEPMDSGFGPYSLSKVCAETGGIYFRVHADRATGSRVTRTSPMASRLRYFFDDTVMRAYRPDYLPAAKVDQMIATNRAKQALVAAASATAVGGLEAPQMLFPREDDGKLAALLSRAQRAAAVLAPRIDALHATLLAGLGDRGRLGPNEKRWQAGYDLALGRVVAAKVRTDAYNTVLAQAKSGMRFTDPRNDTWQLVPSDTVTNAGSQIEKLAGQARTLLERVVKEHPNTPWALIAQEDLRTPLGYEWRETFTGVNVPKNEPRAGGPARPRDDRMRGMAPPKPMRPLQNL